MMVWCFNLSVNISLFARGSYSDISGDITSPRASSWSIIGPSLVHPFQIQYFPWKIVSAYVASLFTLFSETFFGAFSLLFPLVTFLLFLFIFACRFCCCCGSNSCTNLTCFKKVSIRRPLLNSIHDIPNHPIYFTLPAIICKKSPW